MPCKRVLKVGLGMKHWPASGQSAHDFRDVKYDGSSCGQITPLCRGRCPRRTAAGCQDFPRSGPCGRGDPRSDDPHVAEGLSLPHVTPSCPRAISSPSESSPRRRARDWTKMSPAMAIVEVRMSPPRETMMVVSWSCMSFLPLSLSLARVSDQETVAPSFPPAPPFRPKTNSKCGPQTDQLPSSPSPEDPIQGLPPCGRRRRRHTGCYGALRRPRRTGDQQIELSKKKKDRTSAGRRNLRSFTG